MRALFLAAVLALTAAAPAEAGWKLNRATMIAGTVWHHPCAGHVLVTWAYLEGHAGEAGDCTVTFDTAHEWPWEMICTTMIHEYGHLAGFWDPLNPGDPHHSHNQNSVMSAFGMITRGSASVDGREVVQWTGVDGRCNGRGRPYLERHGVL